MGGNRIEQIVDGVLSGHAQHRANVSLLHYAITMRDSLVEQTERVTHAAGCRASDEFQPAIVGVEPFCARQLRQILRNLHRR